MNHKLNIGCPDYEDVSAFLDGELASSSEYKHIEKCVICQKRLEEYRKVNYSIRKELQDSVPENFAVDILAKVREKKERKARKKNAKFFNFPLFMKVAALFIVTVAILFMVLPERISKDNETFDPVSSEPLVFLNEPVIPGHITNLQFPPGMQHADVGSDSIDIGDLMNVSSGNLNDMDFCDIEDKNGNVASIAPEVTQAWSVDNMKSAEKKFAKFAKNAKFTIDKNGNAVAKLKLSKKELAELVRRCKEASFRLLSPNQPQPEQITFAGNQDDKVSYTATIIQAE